jgi:hypothetical protein
MAILQTVILRITKTGLSRFGSKINRKETFKGLELTTIENEPCYSPLNGTITKQAIPFFDDRRFQGVHILSEDESLLMKIFYVKPNQGLIGTKVKRGDLIGTAQNIGEKLKTKNHIYIECYDLKNNVLLDPLKYIF